MRFVARDCVAGTALTIGPHIAAGDGEEYHLKPGTAARFHRLGSARRRRGVILREDTERDGSRVVVNEVPRHGQHIRFRGEDISPGQMSVRRPSPEPRRPELSGFTGYTEASVHRRPSVQLMTTGREQRGTDQERPDHRRKYRGAHMRCVLWALLQPWPVVPDDRAETLAAVQSALTADVLITTGGSVLANMTMCGTLSTPHVPRDCPLKVAASASRSYSLRQQTASFSVYLGIR